MIKLSIFILFSRGLTYCLESICKPRQGRNKWNMFLMGAAGKAGKGPLWSPNTFLFFWNPLLLLSLLLLPPGDKAPKHHLSAMYRLAIGPSVLT